MTNRLRDDVRPTSCLVSTFLHVMGMQHTEKGIFVVDIVSVIRGWLAVIARETPVSPDGWILAQSNSRSGWAHARKFFLGSRA